MDFKVFTDAEGSYENYAEDECGYQLKDGGVLVTWRGDVKVTYGPQGWVRIEEPRHEPFVL
jgi:hypothetical protein